MLARDRLFWAILVLTVIVLLAAGLVAALRRDQAGAMETYLPDESDPVAVVHNAYVAARQQDLDRFLSYFRAPPWQRENMEIVGIYAYALDNAQLQIGTPTIADDSARVPVTLVRQVAGPFFGTRIMVEERTVFLARADGGWLITSPLPFVSPEFGPVPVVPPGGQ